MLSLLFRLKLGDSVKTMELIGLPDASENLQLRPHHIWRAVLAYILCHGVPDDSDKSNSPEDAITVTKLDVYLIDCPEVNSHFSLLHLVVTLKLSLQLNNIQLKA